ncbi:hypothetical protein CCAX7_62060 [Capsulimonas corticalis]|uniref:Uncharacterized protein n=1 Tax=Capsulimonas corticalis TaxID=2219043 RepID=A0A402CWG4_9BACT|nr:hypothetical protein [Capsulimonas corticalis]BDI34155.1 hypothetical protein CCAX7_62060 [Capsulimonas corticalis]
MTYLLLKFNAILWALILFSALITPLHAAPYATPDAPVASSIKKPSVTLVSSRMSGGHTLTLAVTASFPNFQLGDQRQIRFAFELNGTTFDYKTAPQLTIINLTGFDGVTVRKIIRIDLTNWDGKGSRVNRFEENIHTFVIFEAFTTSGGQKYSSGVTESQLVIPLPVVHIHGMCTDLDPDRVPHKLFDSLKQRFPSYKEDDGHSGDFFAHNMLTTNEYPTLVSFDYPSFKEPISYDGQSFGNWIQTELLPRTYAAKVNIVAHSMGGIIARDMITQFSGRFVNRLILVGSPSEGATAIAALRGSNWLPTQIIADTLIPNVHRTFLASIRRCMLEGDDENAREMCPTFPWYSNYPLGDRTIPSDYRNFFLEYLNAYGLDPGVYYYTIVASDGAAIPHLHQTTLDGLWGPKETFILQMGVPGLTGLASELGPGDGCVPLRSQLASDTNWPRGSGPGQLNNYDDVGSVYHTAYFNDARTNQDIGNIVGQGL